MISGEVERLVVENVGRSQPHGGPSADGRWPTAGGANLNELPAHADASRMSEGIQVDAGIEQAERLIALGRAEDALDVLGRLMVEHPDDPKVLGLLANALVGLERYREAEAPSAAALRLAPDTPWLLRVRAMVLLGLRRPADAWGAGRSQLDLAPTDPRALKFFAEVGLRAGKPVRDVRAAVDRAIQIAPDDAGARVLSGQCYESLGQMAPARHEYEAALRLQPDDHAAMLGMARTGAAIGDQVAMARRAGRTVPADSRPLRELQRHATTRIAVVVAIWTTVVPLALAWFGGPVIGAWVAIPALAIWAGSAIACAVTLRDDVARRWASGQRSWWLFDRVVVAGPTATVASVLSLVRHGLVLLYFAVMVLAVWAVGGTRWHDAQGGTWSTPAPESESAGEASTSGQRNPVILIVPGLGGLIAAVWVGASRRRALS